jgi:hypothetical protein
MARPRYEFPNPLTGTGPTALARLAIQLGLPALVQAWREETGQPVPQLVLDYIASRGDDRPAGTPSA